MYFWCFSILWHVMRSKVHLQLYPILTSYHLFVIDSSYQSFVFHMGSHYTNVVVIRKRIRDFLMAMKIFLEYDCMIFSFLYFKNKSNYAINFNISLFVLCFWEKCVRNQNKALVVQHFWFLTERCETCTKVIFNDLYIINIYFWYRLCPIKMTSVIGMSNQKIVFSYRNPDCYSWKRFWSVIYISKINKATRKWNTRHKQLMILSFNNFRFSFTNEQFSIGNGNGFVNKYKLLINKR